MNGVNTLLRIIFCFFLGFVIVGCQTVDLKQSVSPDETKPKVVPKTTDKKVIVKKPKSQVHKYGRFVVELGEDKTRIIGGKFVPDEKPPLVSRYPHVIYINYTTKELLLYSYGEPIIGYAVVTPDPNFLPIEVVRGVVTKIDRAPTWGPTANIRLKYPDLPPGIIPYGHPRNAMGEVKFEVAWNVSGWRYIRIHGTEGYADNGRFWELETFGCVRLQNKAIVNLSDLLESQYTAAKIEIVIFKG